MIRNILVSLMLAVLFLGCGTKSVHVNEKAFEEEDIYIMSALLAEDEKRYATAYVYYNELYMRSNKKEYLYKSFVMLASAREYKKLLERSQEEIEQDDDDLKLRRIEVTAYIGLVELDTALTKALSLLDETKAEEDYMLVASIYMERKEYTKALKYTESAYVINYNEKILDHLAIIMFVNLGRKEDAIAYLQTHSRLYGCSEKICKRLVGFYSSMNDVDGMLEVYLRMYNNNIGGDEIAQAISKIYAYNKDYYKLMLFLEKSGIDDKLLMQVYVKEKMFLKASVVAKRLYDDNGELYYLGQSAIFTYEGAENKEDKAMLEGVVTQLREVINQEDDPTFLNYLGYLMIDHEVDVHQGIKYVTKALEHEPKSGFYLDSLAWGYYKLNECKKAQGLMKDVVILLGSDDEEVRLHVNKIDKCIEENN